MSLIAILLGGLAGAFYTYFLKVNSSSIPQAKKYVFWAFVFSLALSLLVAGETLLIVSWPLIGLAALSGIFVSLVFFSLPRAFKEGPSALSVGIFQSACIVPPLLMALIFGCDCGFSYTLFHGLGALLVIAGFLKSALSIRGQKLTKKWLLYTALACFSQIIILTIYQYQALLTKPALPPHALIISMPPQLASTGWFLPTLFTVVALSCLPLPKSTSLKPNFTSLLGGFTNTASAALLMLALFLATPFTATLMVPINSVSTIFFYNILSIKLLKEKIDWVGMSLAIAGIFLSFM